MSGEVVITSAVRTPFGKYGGGLSGLTAVDMGQMVISEAVQRSRLDPEDVDYVLMGMVIQAGAGQVPSRQASVRAGLPVSVPSDTINKVCASSLRAVNLGELMIRAQDASVVLAGGMESMSQAPYLLRDARWGYRMGHRNVDDAMITDGLWCSFGDCHMGVHGGEMALEFDVDRQQQDEWSLRSHRLAEAAWEADRFAEEVIPVDAPGSRGSTVTVDRDESIRPDTSLEKLSALRPVFARDGTITAGNAPGLNDGAGALMLMSAERARELGIEPLGTIVSQGQVSERPPYLHTVPYLSARQALERAGLGFDDVDIFEVNEAFAAVALTSMKLGEWDPDIVNVNGGAVALGHPIGASGARILMTLIYELRRRGGGLGVATLCSGGGQGEATVVRV